MAEGAGVAPESATPKSLKGRLGAALGRRNASLLQGMRDALREGGQRSRFDKFTEKAKLALQLAAVEARRLRHSHIGTEHLLLGLVASDGQAGEALAELGVGLAEARAAVAAAVDEGAEAARPELSLTERAKRAIELSLEEARRLRHHHIGTEHLLLGLVAEGEGAGVRVLERLGVDRERVRAKVEAMAAHGTYAPEPVGTKDSVVTCRVDPADLWAIDILVEAGIRSTRSDAAQWLIHAGIEANRELFDQVQGTVAEIRRLREQARQLASGPATPRGSPAP